MAFRLRRAKVLG